MHKRVNVCCELVLASWQEAERATEGLLTSTLGMFSELYSDFRCKVAPYRQLL